MLRFNLLFTKRYQSEVSRIKGRLAKANCFSQWINQGAPPMRIVLKVTIVDSKNKKYDIGNMSVKFTLNCVFQPC